MRTIFNYLRFTTWPWVKIKGRYWWWVVKYGGKKNIPPELIFGQMAKSMERMRYNLEQALRVMPQDVSEWEKKELMKAMELAEEMDRKQQELMREAKDKQR